MEVKLRYRVWVVRNDMIEGPYLPCTRSRDYPGKRHIGYMNTLVLKHGMTRDWLLSNPPPAGASFAMVDQLQIATNVVRDRLGFRSESCRNYETPLLATGRFVS